METQKNKEAFEIRNGFSDYIRNASKFFYEVTKINLGDEPTKIEVVQSSEIAPLGLHSGNKIIISDKCEKYGKKILEGVTYHEFFHWALWKSGFQDNFYGGKLIKLFLENEYGFVLPLEFFLENEYKFVLPLKFSLIKLFPEANLRINSIEEGTADFFAANLISKNENEIPINLYFGYFYQDPSTPYQIRFNSRRYEVLNELIQEVYTTYQKFNGLQSIITINKSLKEAEFQIKELANKFYEPSQTDIEMKILPDMGITTVLFAYEIYKEENKNSEQLLRDLVYSPWKTVEKVVREIKNDKDEKILKNAISDFEEGFKEHLRK